MNDAPNKATVLVADDDRMTATVLRFALERAGFDVCVAHDGASAIGAAETQSFDCVLVDHEMPRGKGTDVCAALRRDPRHSSTPVIFLTAKGMELDREMLRGELGVREVFFKPFSMMDVLACVDDALAENGERTVARV